jgi:hypothetical protein
MQLGGAAGPGAGLPGKALGTGGSAEPGDSALGDPEKTLLREATPPPSEPGDAAAPGGAAGSLSAGGAAAVPHAAARLPAAPLSCMANADAAGGTAVSPAAKRQPPQTPPTPAGGAAMEAQRCKPRIGYLQP